MFLSPVFCLPTLIMSSNDLLSEVVLLLFELFMLSSILLFLDRRSIYGTNLKDYGSIIKPESHLPIPIKSQK